MEKSAISKVQKHIFYNFKNGKKYIFCTVKKFKTTKNAILNFFLVQKLIFFCQFRNSKKMCFCSIIICFIFKTSLYRTWFEPSKQVASFIYTTFHALSRNEIPELKILSEKVVPLLTLVKPFELGLQYSKHLHDTTFVKYLDMIVSHQIPNDFQKPNFGTI